MTAGREVLSATGPRVLALVALFGEESSYIGFWGLQEPMLFVKLKMNKQDGYQGMGMQHTSTGLADCGGDDDAGLGFRVLGFRV